MNMPVPAMYRVCIVTPDRFVAEDAAIIVSGVLQRSEVRMFDHPDAAAHGLLSPDPDTTNIALVIGARWDLAGSDLVSRLCALGGVLLVLTDRPPEKVIGPCRTIIDTLPFSERSLQAALMRAIA